MKNIADFKKIIQVFQHYGISLTGKRKSVNFYQGLNMEKTFVQGLIFELEYELKRDLTDEMANTIETPQQLIGHLVSR